MPSQPAPPSEALKKAFRAADGDNSGTIDISELRDLLARLGSPRTAAQCDELVKKVDVDGDGTLTLSEVTSLFESAKLAHTFEELDADHSGSIQASELSSALKKLGYNLSDAKCSELMSKVDANHDGEVSFQEFLSFFEFVPMASSADGWQTTYTAPGAMLAPASNVFQYSCEPGSVGALLTLG